MNGKNNKKESINDIRINAYLSRLKEKKIPSVEKQIQNYRKYQKEKYEREKFKNKKKTMTLKDLDNNKDIYLNKEKINFESKFDKKIITMDDIKSKDIIEKRKLLGYECLEYTNNFRILNKKKELKWNDEIFLICLEHSKNMAEKKVKFGHYGFKKRINKLNFNFFKAFENVAYSNESTLELANSIVKGWINSKGHKKNLLSDSTDVAIASYYDSNKWYFTQIFIKK